MYSTSKNENYVVMTEGIQTFLEDLGLLQYFDMFIIKGFDCEDDLCHIDSADLDAMMIADPDHRHQILRAGEIPGEGNLVTRPPLITGVNNEPRASGEVTGGGTVKIY